MLQGFSRYEGTHKLGHLLNFMIVIAGE